MKLPPTLSPLAFTFLLQHLSALKDAELVSLSVEEARPSIQQGVVSGRALGGMNGERRNGQLERKTDWWELREKGRGKEGGGEGWRRMEEEGSE